MLKILLAVDGSEGALAAARHVVRLAQECSAVDVCVTYVQEPIRNIELMLMPTEDVLDRWTKKSGQVATAAACVVLDDARVPHRVEITSGEPVDKIIELAASHASDLIVMGARGLGAMKGLLLGSISMKIAQLSSIPVTIVK